MSTNRTHGRSGRSGMAGWLAVGVPLTAAALLFGSLNLVALVGSQSSVDTHTYHAAVSRVDVAISSGDVRIRRGHDGQVTVRESLTWAFWQPPASQRVSGGTLSVRTRCGFRVVARCQADYDVTVPAGVAVRVATSSGDVTVDRVLGSLTLGTSSGDIEVHGGRGALLAHTGSGSIEVTGSRAATVRTQTGSGDVALDFGQPPERVDAHTGSGDVRVLVPGHDRYRVDGHTGSGDRSVSVVQDPDADRSITATTGSGDVKVGYLRG